MFDHIEVVTPPEDEPVTLQEGKEQGRISGDVDDASMNEKLIAARERGEGFTRRSFCTQMLDVWYSNPDGVGYFELPRGKVQEIVSITLYDSYNVSSVLDTEIYSLHGTDVVLADWLTSYRTRRGIKIRIISGYGDPEDVPSSIKEGILAYAVHLYENRMGEAAAAKYEVQASGGIPPSVADLWRPYQIKLV
jgi:uncharacterized phiE125 gp8 family phage protein